MSAYLHNRRIAADFVDMLLKARARLAKLYQQNLPEQEKRARKQQLFDDIVHVHYPAFKMKWQRVADKEKVSKAGQYDRWISQSLNNAKLSTFASYHRWQPAFQQILSAAGGDLTVFYRRVEELSKLDSEQRRQTLDTLTVASETQR